MHILWMNTDSTTCYSLYWHCADRYSHSDPDSVCVHSLHLDRQQKQLLLHNQVGVLDPAVLQLYTWLITVAVACLSEERRLRKSCCQLLLFDSWHLLLPGATDRETERCQRGKTMDSLQSPKRWQLKENLAKPKQSEASPPRIETLTFKANEISATLKAADMLWSLSESEWEWAPSRRG